MLPKHYSIEQESYTIFCKEISKTLMPFSSKQCRAIYPTLSRETTGLRISAMQLQFKEPHFKIELPD